MDVGAKTYLEWNKNLLMKIEIIIEKKIFV